MNTTTHDTKASPEVPWAFAWGQYRVWARTARELSTELRTWRKIAVALLILGSALGLASEQIVGWAGNKAVPGDEVPPLLPKILGVVAGIAVALAALTKEAKLTAERETHWLRARAAAEALKADVYRYLARVPPFESDRQEERLLDNAQAIAETVKDLRAVPLTDDERQEKLPPSMLTVDDYIAARLDDQIGFYRDAAVKNHRILSKGRRYAFYLGGAGAVLGVLGMAGITGAGAWVAVVGSIGGAFTAYLYAGRHEYLEISYRVTAEALESLRERWKISGAADSDTDARDRFILECEAVMGRQNDSWFAEGLKQPSMGGGDPS